ncbi:MAG: tyrosine-type recombinase/integrase [Eubacterium sp.]|nr:tyrosine-type recombinase/integrase [Eubacterium sp.]
MSLLSTPDNIQAVNLIRDVQAEIDRLMLLQKNGIINGVDVVIDDLRKKEFKLKEEKVLKVHTNAISEVSIEKCGKQVQRWQTKCGDTRPRCSSYEALIYKLYEYYFDGNVITDYSFKNIFNAALREKIRTECPKEKTIRDYHSSYKAFITDEFGAKDIRLIKPSELKEYIQNVSVDLAPTSKRFYKFKSVLNLAFNYAVDPERRIIEVNPVPAKNAPYKKNLTHVCNKPEDKAFQPEEVEMIRSYLWKRVNTLRYDVNGFAILFASYTGVREGEIPSLKWSDVSENSIHIHSQQNDERRDGKKVYYYNPSTKNEKGVSRDGRRIPITDNLRKVLNDLKLKQKSLGIASEWVFCKADGSWTTTAAYYESLYKVSKKLGLNLSNNHAFRMALNSYVYIPMEIPATERAKLLGHSVETNLRHYTFSRSDDYNDELRKKINAFEKNQKNSNPERGTSGYLKIITFSGKEKSRNSI